MGKSIVHPQLDNIDELEVLSSQQLGWQGTLVEHYQAPPDRIGEQSLDPLLAHWLCFPSPQPLLLVQNHGGRWHESIVKQSDLTWHCKNFTGMTPRQISKHRRYL